VTPVGTAGPATPPASFFTLLGLVVDFNNFAVSGREGTDSGSFGDGGPLAGDTCCYGVGDKAQSWRQICDRRQIDSSPRDSEN
jgi:hypothetical protein